MSISFKLIADTVDATAIQFTSSDDLHISFTDTFGGGTARIDLYKGETIGWESITDTEKTAAEDFVLICEGLNRYRVMLSGSTAPSLNVYLNSDTILRV